MRAWAPANYWGGILAADQFNLAPKKAGIKPRSSEFYQPQFVKNASKAPEPRSERHIFLSASAHQRRGVGVMRDISAERQEENRRILEAQRMKRERAA